MKKQKIKSKKGRIYIENNSNNAKRNGPWKKDGFNNILTEDTFGDSFHWP